MVTAPSLDALARLAAEAAEHLAFYDAPDCGRGRARCGCEVCSARINTGLALEADAPDLARGLVAAVDALRAERDRRDALAAAVREERAAREAVPEGFDADHAGADERARVYALWDAVEAAQKHLDALLSGADADAAGGE